MDKTLFFPSWLKISSWKPCPSQFKRVGQVKYGTCLRPSRRLLHPAFDEYPWGKIKYPWYHKRKLLTRWSLLSGLHVSIVGYVHVCYNTDNWKNNWRQWYSCPELMWSDVYWWHCNVRLTLGLPQLISCKSGKETGRSSFATRSHDLSNLIFVGPRPQGKKKKERKERDYSGS